MKTAKQEFLNLILKKGEKYAGIILGKDGAPDHHLILLPNMSVGLKFNEAVKFAIDSGGELPTRREQSLLFANLKEEFEPSWYWSGELHASNESYAWSQGFYSGGQGISNVDNTCRARAVRRIAIE